MTRKSKILDEYKSTLLSVIEQLNACNFHELMLDLNWDDVDRTKWSRWLSGNRTMAEDRAKQMLSHAIKFKLLGDDVEADASLLLHLLDPRVSDTIEAFKRQWLAEIKAAEVIKNAWRRSISRSSKSTLVQDIDGIIGRNKQCLERAENGDRNILSDAIEYIYYRDSKPELTDIAGDPENLTEYEVRKKRAAIADKLKK